MTCDVSLAGTQLQKAARYSSDVAAVDKLYKQHHVLRQPWFIAVLLMVVTVSERPDHYRNLRDRLVDS